MGGRRLSLRPGCFHDIGVKQGLQPQYGHWREYALHGISIFSNLLYVVGCIFFFSAMPKWLNHAGLWFFIAGGALATLVACVQIWESWRRPSQDWQHNESLENFCYLFAQVLFSAGAVYWLPTLYVVESRNEFMGHAVGAWLFILGSLNMIFASFLNAVGTEREFARAPDRHPPMLVRRFGTLALCCSIFAGCFYLTGSFLFRPGLENECRDHGDRLWIPPVDALPGVAAAADFPVLSASLDPAAGSADVGAGDPTRHPMQQNLGSRKWKRHNATGGFFLAPEPREPTSILEGLVTWEVAHAAAREAKKAVEKTHCVSILEQGTWLFLGGAVISLMNSILLVAATILMDKHSKATNLLSTGNRAEGRHEPYPAIREDEPRC